MFNCMLIDLKGMLTQGFKMGNAEIEPPKSISTATAVTAQIIAQVASHIYGGTTINRIDEVLAPFVTASYNKHRKTAEEWSIPDSRSRWVGITLLSLLAFSLSNEALVCSTRPRISWFRRPRFSRSMSRS